MSIGKVVLASSVALISLAAATYCHLHSILNLHYDGVAHLNIARRILDHPVPHFSHLGTVWLPLHHLLLLPWVQNDFLWSRGLAGTFVSMPAFWLTCYFLFKLSVHLHGESMAGFFSVIAFASNSNILYLQSTPLGEMLYVALFLMSLSWLLKAAESSETSVFLVAIAIALVLLICYDN